MDAGWERDRLMRAMDIAAVLVLCAVAMVEAAAGASGRGPSWLPVLFGAGMTLPLLVRRRAPLAVAGVVSGVAWTNAGLNGLAAGGLGAWLALAVATYAVGAHPDGRRAVVGAVMTMVPTAILGIAKVRAGEDLGVLLSPLVVLGAVWVAGRVGARRRRRAEVVEWKATELQQRADDVAREAALRERARIARELHDVVTHGMSVMVIQSQAAQTLAETDADRAREAMRAVEEAGREALGEMRRLLGVIRHDAGAEERAPQPQLQDVAGLVDRVRQAGLPVSYTAEGDTSVVPGGLAVSAYRIVQEALTNVVKHAGIVSTHVRVAVEAEVLSLQVANEAPVPAPNDGGGAGVGLAGMRERVAVYDGRLETGQTPDGGYTVRAVLPLHRA